MVKSELWWASIGGNACEPIRVMRDKDGRPVEWFSIGCADPHPISEGMQLVEQITSDDVPLTPDQAERQRKAWEDKSPASQGGYRRFK